VHAGSGNHPFASLPARAGNSPTRRRPLLDFTIEPLTLMISGLAGLIALLIGWETSGQRLDCHAAVDRNLHPGCAGRSRIAWPDRGGYFSPRTARLPELLILMLDE